VRAGVNAEENLSSTLLISSPGKIIGRSMNAYNFSMNGFSLCERVFMSRNTVRGLKSLFRRFSLLIQRIIGSLNNL